ncbi:MAG: ABC transporter permease [Elusimicrobia bacterium]|nr:ABC transporter permease [Elusimicrobiota bacterium]
MSRRIRAMVARYVVLHFRSPARVMDLFFWPLMELLVWGFFTVYLQRSLGGTPTLLSSLLFAMVFWDILYRAQQSVSLAFMEEMWTRNILNLLISPLRTWEWVASAYLYGLLKTMIVAAFLMAAAVGLYALDPGSLGLLFVPFFVNLLLMGWALGLVTAGLLIRFGHAAEAIIWGVPFLIQPFSAVFYPLSVYPAWLKPLCLLLPSTLVMEGMRAAILENAMPWNQLGGAFAMNLIYLALASALYGWLLEEGRATGRVVRLTA